MAVSDQDNASSMPDLQQHSAIKKFSYEVRNLSVVKRIMEKVNCH